MVRLWRWSTLGVTGAAIRPEPDRLSLRSCGRGVLVRDPRGDLSSAELGAVIEALLDEGGLPAASVTAGLWGSGPWRSSAARSASRPGGSVAIGSSDSTRSPWACAATRSSRNYGTSPSMLQSRSQGSQSKVVAAALNTTWARLLAAVGVELPVAAVQGGGVAMVKPAACRHVTVLPSEMARGEAPPCNGSGEARRRSQVDICVRSPVA